MSLTEKLIGNFEKLSEDNKMKIIDFVEFLKDKEQKKSENLMDLVIDDNKEALVELAKHPIE